MKTWSILLATAILVSLAAVTLGLGVARFELRCDDGARCVLLERYGLGLWSHRHEAVDVRRIVASEVGDAGAVAITLEGASVVRSSSWSTSLDWSALRRFAKEAQRGLGNGAFTYEQTFRSPFLGLGLVFLVGALACLVTLARGWASRVVTGR